MGHITVMNKNLQSANNIAEEKFKELGWNENKIPSTWNKL